MKHFVLITTALLTSTGANAQDRLGGGCFPRTDVMDLAAEGKQTLRATGNVGVGENTMEIWVSEEYGLWTILLNNPTGSISCIVEMGGKFEEVED